MATVKGLFVHGVPDDKDMDLIRIYEATSEDGTYTLFASYAYTYGVRATECDLIDTTKWYKIEFYNSTDGSVGARSDAVYGGDYDRSKPFVAISTTFDGAGYASLSEIYESANLTASDAPAALIRKNLKIARSYIDILTESQDILRYSNFHSNDISRRKWNASLEMIKQIEINFALALTYRALADDEVMKNIREEKKRADSISIGQTSLRTGETDSELNIARYLDEQAQRYSSQANSMMQIIMPTSVPMSYNEQAMTKNFIHPGDIFTYGTGSSVDSDPEVSQETLDLTGNGASINGTPYVFGGTDPLQTLVALEDAQLIVNGVTYRINRYTPATGPEVEVRSGNEGFDLVFSGANPTIDWNYTAANGGFDLTNSDTITFVYWS